MALFLEYTLLHQTLSYSPEKFRCNVIEIFTKGRVRDTELSAKIATIVSTNKYRDEEESFIIVFLSFLLIYIRAQFLPPTRKLGMG